MREKLIIGGVAQNNRAAWLQEDMCNGIDLDWETHVCDCLGDDNEDHDDCWMSDGSETILIGFIPCEPDDPDAWFANVGEYGSFGYKLDRDAEYSAIVGEIYTQVVASKWVSMCAMCSPCYPGQGDLDTPGKHFTYALPPDLYDTDYDTPLPARPLSDLWYLQPSTN